MANIRVEQDGNETVTAFPSEIAVEQDAIEVISWVPLLFSVRVEQDGIEALAAHVTALPPGLRLEQDGLEVICWIGAGSRVRGHFVG